MCGAELDGMLQYCWCFPKFLKKVPAASKVRIATQKDLNEFLRVIP